MSGVDTYASYAFIVAMVGVLVFVMIYATTRWWESWEGRVIMTQKLLFLGFFVNAVAYWWIGPDYPGRDGFRVVLFTIMPVVFWAMTVLLASVRFGQSPRFRPRRLASAAPQEKRPVEQVPPMTGDPFH